MGLFGRYSTITKIYIYGFILAMFIILLLKVSTSREGTYFDRYIERKEGYQTNTNAFIEP